MTAPRMVCGVLFLAALGWVVAAFAGPLIAVILLVILLGIEYGTDGPRNQAVPFLAAGFVIGIAWFTMTNLSMIVAIGRG